MIKVRRIQYKGHERIGLFFKYDVRLIELVKNIPHRRYSHTLKCWHLPYAKQSVEDLKKADLPITSIELGGLPGSELATSKQGSNQKVQQGVNVGQGPLKVPT